MTKPSLIQLALATLFIGMVAWAAVGMVVWPRTSQMKVTPTALRVTVVLNATRLNTMGVSANTGVPATSTPRPSPLVPSPTNLASLPSATAIAQITSPTAPTVATIEIPLAAVATNAANTVANPTAGGCPVPAGWVAYRVEEGDTLFGFVLGSKNSLSVEQIMAANCLKTRVLSVGQVVHLPPGVAEKSPKTDDSAANPNADAAGGLPAGNSRKANCPCTIAIRAGWRAEQIAAAVDRSSAGFSGRDFLATVAAGAPVPAREFLSTRPAGKSLEGFLFPGTYTLQNDTTAVQFRDTLLEAFAANVGGQLQADAAARGLTFWQAVVLASIIERESGAASEQKLVGSVFHNRLKVGKGLAATVTLQYALGVPGNWTPRVTSVNVASPYNTHLNAGLPPSPIGSPGLSAIQAAIYPAETNYQFFSAKCGGGGNFYAATFAEFEKGLKCN